MKLIQVEVDKSEATSSKSPPASSASSANTKDFDSRDISNDFDETILESRGEKSGQTVELRYVLTRTQPKCQFAEIH